MFKKILKLFAEKTSEREVEAYLKSFESLKPNQVATTLIAVYAVFVSLSKNEGFIHAINTTDLNESNRINNAIIQTNKLLNQNPHSIMGTGLKFWNINLRCIRDQKLKNMGLRIWRLAQTGMEECKEIVRQDIKKKELNGDSAAVESGMKVLESIGFTPPIFKEL